MKRSLGALALAGMLLVGLVPSAAVAASPREVKTGPMLGVVHAKGAKPGGGGSDPNLKFRGGEIMGSSVVEAIYWGPSWSSTSYQGDKVTGLASLYAGFSGSTYMGTNTEYTGTNGTVGKGVSYLGQVFDASATPRRAPSTSAVQTIVSNNISNPVANGYYPVYSDLKRGSAGYCAWHSWGTVQGVLVQFAFFFDLAGDSGCDPADPGTARSQPLEALANVTGHELSEAVTDPHGNGWTDASGSENADKCAWKFDQAVLLSDGSTWKVQGNWSNAAYTAKTGFPNSSGQLGCLYNH